MEETLERRRRTLGPEHPDTLRTARNLAASRRRWRRRGGGRWERQ
ncbi:hypothetical protein MXD95_007570 [Frankia sp. AiPa1]|nr:hypothetical protein [Frankia sp. AiPa1]